MYTKPKKNKTYCRECTEQVSKFKAKYSKELLGTRVLHDGGVSFIWEGEFIFADGANRLLTLPSDQHGELSVLDCKFNAVAKILCRNNRTFEDFTHDALLLLQCIDVVDQESITTWLTNNFMLGKTDLSYAKVEAHLRKTQTFDFGREVKINGFLYTYHMWLGGQRVGH